MKASNTSDIFKANAVPEPTEPVMTTIMAFRQRRRQITLAERQQAQAQLTASTTTSQPGQPQSTAQKGAETGSSATMPDSTSGTVDTRWQLYNSVRRKKAVNEEDAEKARQQLAAMKRVRPWEVRKVSPEALAPTSTTAPTTTTPLVNPYNRLQKTVDPEQKEREKAMALEQLKRLQEESRNRRSYIAKVSEANILPLPASKTATKPAKSAQQPAAQQAVQKKATTAATKAAATARARQGRQKKTKAAKKAVVPRRGRARKRLRRDWETSDDDDDDDDDDSQWSPSGNESGDSRTPPVRLGTRKSARLSSTPAHSEVTSTQDGTTPASLAEEAAPSTDSDLPEIPVLTKKQSASPDTVSADIQGQSVPAGEVPRSKSTSPNPLPTPPPSQAAEDIQGGQFEENQVFADGQSDITLPSLQGQSDITLPSLQGTTTTTPDRAPSPSGSSTTMMTATVKSEGVKLPDTVRPEGSKLSAGSMTATIKSETSVIEIKPEPGISCSGYGSIRSLQADSTNTDCTSVTGSLLGTNTDCTSLTGSLLGASDSIGASPQFPHLPPRLSRVPPEVKQEKDPKRTIPALQMFDHKKLVQELQRRGEYRSCKCGVSFLNSSMYLLHRTVHNTDRPLVCGLCGLQSTSWTDFHTHLIDHDK